MLASCFRFAWITLRNPLHINSQYIMSLFNSSISLGTYLRCFSCFLLFCLRHVMLQRSQLCWDIRNFVWREFDWFLQIQIIITRRHIEFNLFVIYLGQILDIRAQTLFAFLLGLEKKMEGLDSLLSLSTHNLNNTFEFSLYEHKPFFTIILPLYTVKMTRSVTHKKVFTLYRESYIKLLKLEFSRKNAVWNEILK